MPSDSAAKRPSSDLNDLLFTLLAASERRQILRHLLTRQSPVHVTELADVLVQAQSIPGGVVDTEREAHASIILLHTHLPKLVEAGIVEYVGDDEVQLSAFGRELAGRKPRVQNAFNISFRDDDEVPTGLDTPA